MPIYRYIFNSIIFVYCALQIIWFSMCIFRYVEGSTKGVTRHGRDKGVGRFTHSQMLQKYTRARKYERWEMKAEELQRAADRNDMKGFYSGLKEVLGSTDETTCTSEII